MQLPFKAIVVAIVGAMVGAGASFALMFAMPVTAQASRESPLSAVQAEGKKHHGMIIHVDQNDPAIMKMALNNAENLIREYEDRGEEVEVEFVVYGPGLHMLRSDTSPVKDHLSTLSSNRKNVTFSGCGNTIRFQSKQEHKDITLVSEARVVPAGIARILDLQEQGWGYVRP